MIHTIGIVSLSSGILGEARVRHERDIGLRRLREAGLDVRFLPHALAGTEALRAHPEWRAEDLLRAFRDPELDMILCAIGGDDTYRLLPYLFDRDALREALRPVVFLGFSDSTVNHLMLHKLGLPTFYGQAFLPDLCELGPEMLPYSQSYFAELVATGTIREIRPSPVWYGERQSFDPSQVGVALPPRADRGFELLQGPPRFAGKILGGCLDSLYDLFDGTRWADMPELCQKYGLFPEAGDWEGRILLLETSEEKMPPETFRRALELLRARGVFDAVKGVLVGKPMDESWWPEYRRILPEVIARPELPILCNLNVGHALPRCIVPFGLEAEVDAEEQVIRFSQKG